MPNADAFVSEFSQSENIGVIFVMVGGAWVKAQPCRYGCFYVSGTNHILYPTSSENGIEFISSADAIAII